jgi:hypothetical protein
VNSPNSNLSFSLTEAIAQATARLVDDSGAPRLPSHHDIETVFRRSGVIQFDPHRDNSATKVGKHKRVREVLNSAIDNGNDAGAKCVEMLIGNLRGNGGFRVGSDNYCGDDVIASCIAAFSTEPVELTLDGQLRPRSLEGLNGRQLSDAIRTYVERARRGYADSVLVAGTNKDLIEAVAGHVIAEVFNTDPSGDFPTVLGQAFTALGLTAIVPKQQQGGLQGARDSMSVALYQLAIAVNRLRNKAGIGHGRPFIPDLTVSEVRAATEATGLVAGRLLDALEDKS